MHTKRLFSLLVGLVAFGAATLSSAAWAQDSSSVNQAFKIARQAVGPDMQTRVVSVYGVGTPEAISKWYIIFYDPSVASHGHAVLVQSGQIIKSYVAQGGTTYSGKLTFDPSRITNEQPALHAAQNYATRHNIAYDNVRALLKETSLTKPFRWRIQLLSGGKSEGYVLVNALDDSVAAYISPEEAAHPTASSKDGGVAGDLEGFGDNVKSTFLGIGGDLQQFFTGERTVDK